MAFVLMTQEELQTLGIASQTDTNLDLENGTFNKSGWNFAGEFVNENGSSRRKYTNKEQVVYLINENTAQDGFTEYKFYKET